jgi:ribonuclease HI
MKKVIIYTDGACSGNPGAGGWGAILKYGLHEKEISGFASSSTNNQMELTAAVEAIRCLKEPCEIDLFSDSAYLINGFNESWLEKWKNNGWKTTSKNDVKNIELWKALDEMNKMHRINWIKVKGHSDNEYNNRCVKIATGQIKKKIKSIDVSCNGQEVP